MRLTIGRKLGLGFGAIIVSVVVSSLIIYSKVNDLRAIHSRVVDIRYSTGQAREKLLDGINQSLDALWGYAAPGSSEAFIGQCKQQRQAAWGRVHAAMADLEYLSVGWSPVDTERLGRVKAELELFGAAQQAVEDIAQTDKNIPAMHLLLTEGAPQAAELLDTLARIIDEEAKLEATPQRKLLLKDLGQSRSSLAAAIASLRAYLFTGDDGFKSAFDKRWAGHQVAHEANGQKIGLLTLVQRPLWDRYARLHESFSLLPARLMKLRSGQDWNTANYWLGTKVVPRAVSIKSILNQIAEAQREQMNQDRRQLEAVAEAVTTTLATTTAVATIIAFLVAVASGRRIVSVIQRLVDRAKAIAGGDWGSDALITSSKDELGELAIAINDMSNALSDRMTEVTDRATELEAEVSSRKRAEANLRHIAQHDVLTGMANRNLFTDRLEQAIERANQDRSYMFAVLFMDVDRFKVINDTLGHEVGDHLLVSFANRIREVLGECNGTDDPGASHLAARLGGDEFVVLLEGVGEREADVLANRIQESVSQPHETVGREVHITVSIGMVISKHGYSRTEEILRDADQALYEAKANGRARCVVFDKKMHSTLLDRLSLETDLHRCLREDQLRLRYQPIVSIESGHLLGFEALLRWHHPQRGVLMPDEFIPLAGETGLIVPIGDWIINHVCGQLHDWQHLIKGGRQLTMSVNLHQKQLMGPDLVDRIKTILCNREVDPKGLIFEISESCIKDEKSGFDTVLNELHQLGVGLSIDDFGTGYSSLSHLYRSPINEIKIDRAHIGAIEKYTGYVAIIHAIITLAHNLGMTVAAEGIESIDQLACLQSLDCDKAQGFYFAQPVDAQTAQYMITSEEPVFRFM